MSSLYKRTSMCGTLNMENVGEEVVLNGWVAKQRSLGSLIFVDLRDKSGIVLEAYTTQPGVQLYTGNFVDEDAAPFGKNERRAPRYGGFCLETQHFPSSPNFPEFPSTLLSPGEEYRQITVYKFRG